MEEGSLDRGTRLAEEAAVCPQAIFCLHQHLAEVLWSVLSLGDISGLGCGVAGPLSLGPRMQWLSFQAHSSSADPEGHVIDLVNDQLPDISISEEDKKKNLALLEEAKSVSERFLTRRGRRSRSSPGDSPSGRQGQDYRWFP